MTQSRVSHHAQKCNSLLKKLLRHHTPQGNPAVTPTHAVQSSNKMSHPNDDVDNPLMTRRSLALSLSPPRAPPFDSAQRASLLGKNPSHQALAQSKKQSADDREHHECVRQRILKGHRAVPYRKPHPHLLPKSDEETIRWLGTVIPMSFLNHVRTCICRQCLSPLTVNPHLFFSLGDSGKFRSIVDGLVTSGVPAMAVTQPSLAGRFLHMTATRKTLRYGNHSMQIVDMFFPKEGTSRGLVFFVVSLQTD